jgi:hypothetical protein
MVSQVQRVEKPLPRWCGARHGLITTAALALVAISVLGRPGWADDAHGQEQGFSVPLRCQVDGGPWRDCQMEVEQLGAQWHLVLGTERYGFQHDGRGLVRMRRGQGEWTPVQTRWSADASLCWDGLCAQGAIPLD